MKDTEKIIRQVNGNMAIEGMPITEADKARIRICLNDNSRFSKEIILKKYEELLLKI